MLVSHFDRATPSGPSGPAFTPRRMKSLDGPFVYSSSSLCEVQYERKAFITPDHYRLPIDGKALIGTTRNVEQITVRPMPQFTSDLAEIHITAGIRPNTTLEGNEKDDQVRGPRVRRFKVDKRDWTKFILRRNMIHQLQDMRLPSSTPAAIRADPKETLLAKRERYLASRATQVFMIPKTVSPADYTLPHHSRHYANPRLRQVVDAANNASDASAHSEEGSVRL